jgi:hypothetical protein
MKAVLCELIANSGGAMHLYSISTAALQRLYSVSTAALQRLCSGSAAALQRLYCCSTATPQWQFSVSAASLQHLSTAASASLQRLYSGSAAALQRLCSVYSVSRLNRRGVFRSKRLEIYSGSTSGRLSRPCCPPQSARGAPIRLGTTRDDSERLGETRKEGGHEGQRWRGKTG